MDWPNPTVAAAVAGAVAAVLTKVVDLLLSSKKHTEETRQSDREAISADQKAFLQTIISQLRQCHDENASKDKELDHLRRENVTQAARIAHLEWRVSIFEEKK